MNTLTNLEREYLKDLVYEAQESLNAVIHHLQTYVRKTGDHEAEAYIVDHLTIIAGRDHGFLADDLNLDDLLERLDERDDADEDTEEDDTAEPALHSADGGGRYWSIELGRNVTVPSND